MAKFRMPFSLRLKRQHFFILGTKSRWKEKQRKQTKFFLEILKAVCFSLDLLPKLIQKSFQTMEQKLVERCETKVVADACNASCVV